MDIFFFLFSEKIVLLTELPGPLFWNIITSSAYLFTSTTVDWNCKIDFVENETAILWSFKKQYAA